MHRYRLALLLWAFPALAYAQTPPADGPPAPAPAPAPVDPQPPQPPPDPVATCKQLRHDIALRASTIADANARGRVLLSLPDCDHVSPAALSTLAATEQALPPPSPPLAPYHHTGLAFGAQLELVPTVMQTGLLTNTVTSLFVGYQAEGIAVGGLLSLDHNSAGAGSVTESASTVRIGAQLRGTLARSETGATELLLVADATYVALGSSTTMMEPTLYTFHVGPSIRHWLTPSFALAATGAARFDVTSQDNTDSTVIATLAYSLDLEGVF